MCVYAATRGVNIIARLVGWCPTYHVRRVVNIPWLRLSLIEMYETKFHFIINMNVLICIHLLNVRVAYG